jgi:hypothetical protein
MKKLFGMLVIASLMLSAVPGIFAVSVGTGVGVDIETEDFDPLVWSCTDRVVNDDNVEWGRNTEGGEELLERNNNYAFEGESITWDILVMDKNGINKIEDVFATIGDVQGEGNDIEVNCVENNGAFGDIVNDSCNARILEEDLSGTDIDPAMQRYYTCTLTVETPDSMYGEYWVTVEAIDLDGLSGTMDENEYWFLNPVIALSIDGLLEFEDVRPGVMSYSETLLVGNDADDSSGVMLDMFISGTDFYDSSSAGTMCPTTNQLALNGDGPDGTPNNEDDTGFRYFAVNGAYSTRDDLEHDEADAATSGKDTVNAGEHDPATDRDVDPEGYVNIQYGDVFGRNMYNEAEILQANPISSGGGDVADLGYAANFLAPGAEMAVTFRLNLPEPCNGDFDTGDIFFWGEAI